ncbi:MAG TPA: hypothetical protein VLC91_03370 [Spongiibacteraceae bacterium]|nr:hypothetical protein [Spongiibacteraceae bacterium]
MKLHSAPAYRRYNLFKVLQYQIASIKILCRRLEPRCYLSHGTPNTTLIFLTTRSNFNGLKSNTNILRETHEKLNLYDQHKIRRTRAKLRLPLKRIRLITVGYVAKTLRGLI